MWLRRSVLWTRRSHGASGSTASRLSARFDIRDQQLLESFFFPYLTDSSYWCVEVLFSRNPPGTAFVSALWLNQASYSDGHGLRGGAIVKTALLVLLATLNLLSLTHSAYSMAVAGKRLCFLTDRFKLAQRVHASAPQPSPLLSVGSHCSTLTDHASAASQPGASAAHGEVASSSHVGNGASSAEAASVEWLANRTSSTVPQTEDHCSHIHDAAGLAASPDADTPSSSPSALGSSVRRAEVDAAGESLKTRRHGSSVVLPALPLLPAFILLDAAGNACLPVYLFISVSIANGEVRIFDDAAAAIPSLRQAPSAVG